ncbi:hypothetical protein GCM10010344_75670 [Streptomyces bluensis]|nr:hypothetical protein GCM10010344_75670 [Streptomyces bluensis]
MTDMANYYVTAAYPLSSNTGEMTGERRPLPAAKMHCRGRPLENGLVEHGLAHDPVSYEEGGGAR